MHESHARCVRLGMSVSDANVQIPSLGYCMHASFLLLLKYKKVMAPNVRLLLLLLYEIVHEVHKKKEGRNVFHVIVLFFVCVVVLTTNFIYEISNFSSTLYARSRDSNHVTNVHVLLLSLY